MKAWDMSKVESKEAVEERTKRENRKVHFGSLMELCFLKHAEKAAQSLKHIKVDSSLEEIR